MNNFLLTIRELKKAFICPENLETFSKALENSTNLSHSEIETLLSDISTLVYGNLYILINICKENKSLNYLLDYFPKEDLRLSNDFASIEFAITKNKFTANDALLSCYSPALKYLWLRDLKDKTCILNGIAMFRNSAAIEYKYGKDLAELDVDQTYEVFKTLPVTTPTNFNLFKHTFNKYKQYVKNNIATIQVTPVITKINYKTLITNEDFKKENCKDLDELLHCVDHIYMANGYKKANVFAKLFLFLTALGADTYDICNIKQDDVDVVACSVNVCGKAYVYDSKYSELLIDALNAGGKSTVEVGHDRADCKVPTYIEISDYLFKRKNFKLDTPNDKRIYRYITSDALETVNQLQSILPDDDPVRYKNITRFAAARIADNNALIELEQSCNPLTYDAIVDSQHCSIQTAYNQLAFYDKWKSVFITG